MAKQGDREHFLEYASKLDGEAEKLEQQAAALEQKDPPDRAGAAQLRTQAQKKRQGAKTNRELAAKS